MNNEICVAVIGLDTSHSIEYVKRMQGYSEKSVKGLRAVSCLRFPSPFQSEPQQDDRQAVLESWGVKVTRDLNEALAGVDGVLMEINDPSLHLPYFQKIVEAGLPIYIDKPLAADFESAQSIAIMAEQKGIQVWEASPLRFSPALMSCMQQSEDPRVCNIFGALGSAPSGSSVIWYGCHTFQMLQQVMGNEVDSVRALSTNCGILTHVSYSNGRTGVVENIRGTWNYGGRIVSSQSAHSFQVDNSRLYDDTVERIRDFFLLGEIPVPLEDSLAVMSLLEAVEESLETGREVNMKPALCGSR